MPNGRDILPSINHLLGLPFALKIATKDWHPNNHISFAANHANAEPYASTIVITNPSNTAESYETRLWPVHCVQNTAGAEFVPELMLQKIDKIVNKGLDARVEMYSAFYDPLKEPRVSDTGLAGMLKDAGITHCFVVGLAADYCVRATALDAASEGFKTCIVEEGTRPVDMSGWSACKGEIMEKGVTVISLESEELKRVASLKST